MSSTAAMVSPERWRPFLECPECGGSLEPHASGDRCIACQTVYEVVDGRPLLMTPADRERLLRLIHSTGATMESEYRRRRSSDRRDRLFRRLSPPLPVYVDPAAPPLPHAVDGLNLWLGGGGLDTGNFVNIDIGPYSGVDIIANAARIPFRADSCDRIACLALLEHVEEPKAVVAEMYRVLKPGGTVDVVVPFCHPYHPYPDDFQRFSRQGLARLFAGFDDVVIGIRTGPATTILTMMTYFWKLIFPVHAPNPVRRWVNRGVVGLWGWTTAPLCYADRWLNRAEGADALANHFYLTAAKPKK